MPGNCLVVLICMLALLPSGVVWAQDIPTATTSITKDDLIAHPVGREVKDLNDRMRKVGQDAEAYEKGSDSYKLLKSGFDDLEKKRDKVGEAIRGLRDMEVVVYGDKAVGDPNSVKQAVIDFYIRNPGQRHIQPFHAYFDKNGNGPLVSAAPPNPADVGGGQKRAAKPPPGPAYYGDPIIVNPPDYDHPTDDCVCILGQCPPGC